jgi:multidrug efflux pump subunit AcrA (membrane-fusion protein)
MTRNIRKPVTLPFMRAAVLMATIALAACGKSDEGDAKAEPVRPVLYMVVEPRPATQAGFAGTIEPRYSTDLAFRVLGRIITRPVQVGDLVQKGETVATLDPSTLDLAIQSAKADLASAEAQFANASASEERQRILQQCFPSGLRCCQTGARQRQRQSGKGPRRAEKGAGPAQLCRAAPRL